MREAELQVEYLKKLIPDWLEIVDLDHTHWQNNDRTLVFVEPYARGINQNKIHELIVFIGSSRSDEFEYKTINGENVIRLSWRTK